MRGRLEVHTRTKRVADALTLPAKSADGMFRVGGGIPAEWCGRASGYGREILRVSPTTHVAPNRGPCVARYVLRSAAAPGVYENRNDDVPVPRNAPAL
jgi:hypothetical protein